MPEKIVKISTENGLKKETIFFNPNDTTAYTEVTFYPSGKIKDSIDYINQAFHGRILEFFENGNKKFEGETRFGTFRGRKINYYENGRIRQIDSLLVKCPTSECCCDAIITRYYESGEIREKQTMKGGLVNGTLLRYYKNGQLKEQINLIDEKREGLTRTWYENGRLSTERMYKNDLQEGPVTEYYDDYKVYGQHANDKEEGEWKYFDTSGRLTALVVYKKGKKISSKSFK